jgi:hypothetical protein
MIEVVADTRHGVGAAARTYFCNICSHEWSVVLEPWGGSRPSSRWCSAPACARDELTTLADIGALNAFTNERRSACGRSSAPCARRAELFSRTKERTLVEGDFKVRLARQSLKR